MLSVLQIVIIHPAKTGQHAGVTGPERRTANILRRWCEVSVKPIVCYPRRGSLWDHIINSNAEVIDFEISGKLDFGAVFIIKRIAKRKGVMLIHTQGSPALDLLACLGGLLAGVPVVVTRPAMIEDQLSYSWLRRSIYGFFDRLLTLRMAARIVAVSAVGQRHLQRYSKVKPEKLKLIYNGINLSRFTPKLHTPFTGAPEQPPVVIGMVGQLYPAKGWPDFIEVIGHLHRDGLNIRALIVGDGELRQKLERRVAVYKLEQVIAFTGFQSDVSGVLQQMDFFLLTSHIEGLPVAVIEAMASGLAVISTDVGGVCEEVEEGQNGFLVQIGDIDRMVVLCTYLIKNPKVRTVMGKISRTIAEEKFSEDRMLEEYARCYKNVGDWQSKMTRKSNQ